MEIKASLFAIIIVILFNLLFPQFSKTPFFVAAIKNARTGISYHSTTTLYYYLFMYHYAAHVSVKKEKKRIKLIPVKLNQCNDIL